MHAAPMAGWSAVRWPEWAHIALYVLDTVRGLSADDRAMLVEVASLAQRQGFDWVAYYTDPSASPSFMADGVPFARGWTLTEARRAPGGTHPVPTAPTLGKHVRTTTCSNNLVRIAARGEQRDGAQGRRGDVAPEPRQPHVGRVLPDQGARIRSEKRQETPALPCCEALPACVLSAAGTT